MYHITLSKEIKQNCPEFRGAAVFAEVTNTPYCFGRGTVAAGVLAATFVGFAGGGNDGLVLDAVRGFTGS